MEGSQPQQQPHEDTPPDSSGWAGVMESVSVYGKVIGTGMISEASHKHASTMTNGQAKKRSAQASRSNGGTSMSREFQENYYPCQELVK